MTTVRRDECASVVLPRPGGRTRAVISASRVRGPRRRRPAGLDCLWHPTSREPSRRMARSCRLSGANCANNDRSASTNSASAAPCSARRMVLGTGYRSPPPDQWRSFGGLVARARAHAWFGLKTDAARVAASPLATCGRHLMGARRGLRRCPGTRERRHPVREPLRERIDADADSSATAMRGNDADLGTGERTRSASWRKRTAEQESSARLVCSNRTRSYAAARRNVDIGARGSNNEMT